MENKHRFRGPSRDVLIGAALFLSAFALYLRTLAPSVAFMFDDSLEMQYVIPRLGIVHPTGYPLYTLLAKLFTILVPLNSLAFRLNLFSASSAALAVAMLYLVLRQLTAARYAALIGASVFAVGQIFWEQSVIAEIYAMQMLLVATLFYLALVWKQEYQAGNLGAARTRLYLLALAMGMSVTHHRLIVLLFPALALYVWLVNRGILKDWRTLVRSALFFVIPLASYLYLPLRGAIGSANGEYENSLQGFWKWVTASDYTVFLTGDPFKVQHDAAFYWSLFQSQMGLSGLALAAVGLVWLLKRKKEWSLVLVASLIQAGFVFNYRVADVQVHFLTLFMLITILLSVGADALFTILSSWREGGRRSNPFLLQAGRILAGALVLLIPLNLLISNYSGNDLSNKWDIHDYGMDILNQPLPKDATIIGIQGEITLIRYFQETQGIRPDIQTIAADDPKVRLGAVERAVKENRTVYLTRPLEGIEAKYSLSSRGPLIAILEKSAPIAVEIAHRVEEDLSPSVHLLGYSVDASQLKAVPDRWHIESGRQLRVTLYWSAVEKPAQDAMVSLKLMDKEQHNVGQIDRHPVLDAYRTIFWRAGETIEDTYTVPVYAGTVPGQYSLIVTLYESQSGIVIGQKELERIALDADLNEPRREALNVTNPTDVDFGAFTLKGFTLDLAGPVRPGDPLPMVLLWRAKNVPIQNDLVTRIWLEDALGRVAASRDVALGDKFPVAAWQVNQFVREAPTVRVPANVADGRYQVKLAVARKNQQLGFGGLPLGSVSAKLGEVEIKNRPRVMSAPAVPELMEAAFGKKIKLLGYELTRDIEQRGVRLTLYWKALDLMSTSYTVFVHLIDGNNAVISTADAAPGNGDLPTSGWIENEFVTDVHSFTLPPDMPEGGYPIEIGLYDPLSGERLKTADGEDRVILTAISP